MEADPIALLIKAVAFAAEKHRYQMRKNLPPSPYINHPIALADLLANEAGVLDVHVLCAAVLHDTIEDTQTSYEELSMQFGERVASMVAEVTDDKSLAKEERKRLQIEHASHASHGARLVKLADKLCNLRDLLSSPPGDWSLERKLEYFDWSGKVVDGMRGTHPGLEAAFDSVYARRAQLV